MKYSRETKYRAVRLASRVGAALAAKKYGVSKRSLYRWTGLFPELHMRNMRAYDLDFKFDAVSRANDVGRHQAAKEFGISSFSIIRWRKLFPAFSARASCPLCFPLDA